MRILVIDDQPGVRMTIAVILGEGYEVVGAESGAAGLREFANSNFDVAIVDYFLQGIMNGRDVMMSMRERVPTLPIVAISGAAALDFLTQNSDLRNVVSLPKPFRPNELMAAIEAAIRSRTDWMSVPLISLNMTLWWPRRITTVLAELPKTGADRPTQVA